MGGAANGGENTKKVDASRAKWSTMDDGGSTCRPSAAGGATACSDAASSGCGAEEDVEMVDAGPKDVVDDGRMDVETESSGFSKTSKCLGNKQRSSGWKAKRIVKYRERRNQQRRDAGEEELLPHDEYREQQRRKMVIILDAANEGVTVSDGKTEENITMMLEKLGTQQLTLEENVGNFILSTGLYWEAKFLPKPDKEWYAWTEHQQLERRGPYGLLWCVCCAKYTDDNHKVRSVHISRVNELACCNMMMGIGGSRRFSPTAGFMGYCNAHEFRNFGERMWIDRRSLS